MDFGALPPEINSARIYAGPGSGPMLAAAAAWDGLAAELGSAASSYSSVISGLTGGPWLGPASVSMAAAAAPYVAWMNTTAAQAAQTAAQARAAAGAYEAARAMTVPPPAIAANRSLLMSLIATNILGQNTPAIAVTEAHYAAMWAQDAAAMYSYAGASASASTLTPLTPPQPATNPAGLAGQGAAVAQATGSAASTNTQAVLSQVTSTVPTALQQLASPLSSTSSTGSTPSLSSLSSSLSNINPFLSSASQIGWIGASLLSSVNQVKSLMPAISSAASNAASGSGLTGGLASGLANGLGSGALGSTGSAGLGGAAVSAGMGRAATVGALSVPPTWAAAAPTMSPAATLLGTSLGAASAVETGGPASVLGGMPLASTAGRAGGGLVPDPRFLERPAMVPRWSGPG
ncbi:PPE family protein [Mycobacterium nebraskense]|uniref:PPE family protein n=1 Tax=Mycobacterium nebraskense TaxID=244292 RepID=UPI000641B8FB|nr:PPE family protein [Mycobacterium nebraskense]KLO44666.1 PPE family protein [Mycobacterium nebraskense]